jgi:sugar/nucleoside kinase (ribokinase family)
MKKHTLLGLGNALVDTEFEVNDAFLQENKINKGQMTLIDAEIYKQIFTTLSAQFEPKKRTGGGSAANSMVIFSQLGGAARYCCRVADDEFGQFYTQDLKDQGVICEPAYADGVTGKCIVLITPDAQRTMLTYLGSTADLCVNDIDFSHITNADWLFMEGYLVTAEGAFELAKKAIVHAKQQGIKIALSFSDPAIVSFFHSQITELLTLGIDLLFANEEEVLTWSKQEDLTLACEAIGEHSKKIVVTLGERGCAIYNTEHNAQMDFYSGVKANVVDTNGAGDSFAGAFLYATQQNWSEEKSAKLSNRVASTMVADFGARTSQSKIQNCK